MDISLINLRIAEDLFDRVEGASEEIFAQFLKTGTSEGRMKVNSFEEGVDFDGGGCSGGERSLCTLTSGTETTESTRVGGDILLVFAFELLDEVVDKSVVEVHATQVRVTCGGLDLRDTLLDGQEGYIEGSSTEIKDQDIAFASGPHVKTVRDGGSGGLVDDTEDVQATDGTRVLGGLTLRVVEARGDGDDCIGDRAAEVRFGGFLHPGQDHGGDFFGRLKQSLNRNLNQLNDQTYEFLVLATVLDLDVWLSSLVDDLEGEVLDIGLHFRIGESTADKTFNSEDTGRWR